MKSAAIALAMSVVLVACSGSDAAAPSSPSAVVPSSPTPVQTPSPNPAGFCGDRAVIGDLYHLIRAGTVPYRQAAASAVAAGKVVRADADLASGLGARKIRQFVLYINTLRLAILGAATNYPDDFAVKQFTNGLVARTADIADTLNCPPPA
jgi:hypothetical protein